MTAIDAAPQSARTTGLFLLLIMAAGLVLRVAAAMGGLWTDEAWSVVYAMEAGSPLGVITSINHDNNHHLNSWWLQLVGPDASPLLMRSLAIITSTATIGVAALIGRRRGRLAALFTALLFAVCPFMVLYGSEARGYAPMMLALVTALWLVDGWLMRGDARFPVLMLIVLTVAGALSHLLMIPAMLLVALGLWLALIDRHGVRSGTHRAAQAAAPAVIAALAVGLLVVIMAATDAKGLRVGGYTPFSFALFGQAMAELAALTSGIGPIEGNALAASGVGLVLLAFALLWPPAMPKHRWALLIPLALAVPLAVALLRPGNAQFARYYLPVTIACLLFIGDWAAAALRRRGAARLGAGAVLTVLVAGSVWMDHRLIMNGRGEGARPVEVMAASRPDGASVHINMERARAILITAARQAGFALTVSDAACPAPDFAFVERERQMPAPAKLELCGWTYTSVSSADAIGPSGQSWTLFAKVPLQSPKPAVNSAPPRR